MKTDFVAEYNHGLVEEEIQKIGIQPQSSLSKKTKVRKSFIASQCFHIQAGGSIWDTLEITLSAT